MSIPRNVWLIASAFFFVFFGLGTAQQYLVILFNNQGRGHLALAVLFILYGTFLITGIFVAKIIPRLGGLAKSIVIGGITYILFCLAIATGNIFLLFVGAVTIGVGAGLLWVSSGQIISDSSDEHTMGRNLAIQTVGTYSGNILGIYMGAYLIRTLPMAQAYLILAGFVAIGVLILLFIRPNKEELKPRPFKPLFMFDKKLLAILPIVFGVYFLQTQVFTAMNVIVVSLLGIAFIPMFVTVIKVSNIVGSFSSGTISGWMSKRTLLVILIIVSLIGIAIFTGARTSQSVIISAIMLGFSMVAIYPVVLAWLKESMPPEEFLYVLGVFHVYSNIGVITAILTNLYLPSSTSFIPGTLALVLAIPGVFVFKRLTEHQNTNVL